MRLSTIFYILIYLIPISTYASRADSHQRRPSPLTIEQRQQIARLKNTLDDIRQRKITGDALNQSLWHNGTTALGYALAIDQKDLWDHSKEKQQACLNILLEDPQIDIHVPCACVDFLEMDSRFNVTRRQATRPNFTPLLLVAKYYWSQDRYTIMETLLKKNANPNFQDPVTQQTAAHVIAQDNVKPDLEKQIACLTLLKKHSADFNLQDIFGNTPLHRAARFINYRLMNILLTLEANPKMNNNDDLTAQDIFDSFRKKIPAQTPDTMPEEEPSQKTVLLSRVITKGIP